RVRGGGMEERVGGGRLEPGSAAPAEGERSVDLVAFTGARVEQILSGRLSEPLSFEQAHDEWVVVTEGRARMLIDGEEITLARGDWLLLPAGCPHTVLGTQPGTAWLAVHVGEKT